MFFTFRRVNRISVVPVLAMVVSVAILAGVAAIMAVAVAVACGVALLRAIGVVRPANPSVPLPDHATIEGVVVDSSDIADPRI
jgi:hypothetical protein